MSRMAALRALEHAAAHLLLEAERSPADAKRLRTIAVTLQSIVLDLDDGTNTDVMDTNGAAGVNATDS